MKEVNNYSELKLNERVKTSGKIISINTYEDFSIIKLDNNITLTCNCLFQKNQTIRVEGRVIDYKSKLEIQGEKIKEVKNVS